MDNTKSSDTKTPTPTTDTTYGNLEITVEGMTQDQLNSLLEFVTEKVESIGLKMVARSYMTTDTDYEDIEEDSEDAEEPKTTAKG